MLNGAIFSPGIEPVEHNAFLPGFDEVFSVCDGLLRYPVFAFGLANHFAKGFFAFAVGSAFDATFGHFLINHVAKMNLGYATSGKIIYGDGFAAASHADDGEKFNVVVFHGYYYNTIKVRSVYD